MAAAQPVSTFNSSLPASTFNSSVQSAEVDSVADVDLAIVEALGDRGRVVLEFMRLEGS